jgi:hypothetical protein
MNWMSADLSDLIRKSAFTPHCVLVQCLRDKKTGLVSHASPVTLFTAKWLPVGCRFFPQSPLAGCEGETLIGCFKVAILIGHPALRPFSGRLFSGLSQPCQTRSITDLFASGFCGKHIHNL